MHLLKEKKLIQKTELTQHRCILTIKKNCMAPWYRISKRIASSPLKKQTETVEWVYLTTTQFGRFFDSNGPKNL